MSLFCPTESSRLTVVRANEDDSGIYKCEAANIYSTSNSEVIINVEGILNFDLCVLYKLTDQVLFINKLCVDLIKRLLMDKIVYTVQSNVY